MDTASNVDPHMQRMEEFILSSITRGYDVHQMSWESVVGKELPSKAEDGNCSVFFAGALQWVEQILAGLNLVIFTLPICQYLFFTKISHYTVYATPEHSMSGSVLNTGEKVYVYTVLNAT